MKIYEIKEEYINYLHSIDNRVEKATGESYKFSRKYLGIVLEINELKYFAPLSSTKSKKDYFPDGKIRPSVIPLIRITSLNKDGSVSLLGKIQLNNMIPLVNESIVKLYDIEKEIDIKYKNMIYNQINFINKNEKLIKKNAKILYKNKIRNLDIGYIKNTVNFKLLEEKALEYISLKENLQDDKKVNTEKINNLKEKNKDPKITIEENIIIQKKPSEVKKGLEISKPVEPEKVKEPEIKKNTTSEKTSTVEKKVENSKLKETSKEKPTRSRARSNGNER